MQCCGAEAHFLVGRSREPDPPFRNAKNKSLVLVISIKSVQDKYDPKKICINKKNSHLKKNIVSEARAAWSRQFYREPEPPFFVWSRSRNRLWDLGRPEPGPDPEPPKKVAAPQHWTTQWGLQNVTGNKRAINNYEKNVV